MFYLTLMSKGEKRSGLDATVGDLSSLSRFASIPKGDIVGMFTGIVVCLSLMARTEGGEKGSISLGGGENNIQRSKIRRDSTLCFPKVQPRSKRRTRRRSEDQYL
jgi:hypothetical protein